MEKIERTIGAMRIQKIAAIKALHESNMELKTQIASSKAELDRLTALLRVVEQPYCAELQSLEAKLTLASKMRETIRDVAELKTKVHKCTNGSRLHNIFEGNRFATFYYNDATSGFYTNNGGEGDRGIADPDSPVLGVDHVEFDCYAAYTISKSPLLSRDEKVKQLDELFDVFLGK